MGVKLHYRDPNSYLRTVVQGPGDTLEITVEHYGVYEAQIKGRDQAAAKAAEYGYPVENWIVSDVGSTRHTYTYYR